MNKLRVLCLFLAFTSLSNLLALTTQPANAVPSLGLAEKELTLHTLLSGLPETIDVTNVKTLVEWTVLYNIGFPLIGGGPDGTLYPGLADSWLVDPLKKSIKFKLGHHRFSDGSTITSADVKATLMFHCDYGGSKKILIKDILNSNCSHDSIKVTSDYELEIFFKVSPYFALPYFSIADLIVLKSKSIEDFKHKKTWRVLFVPSSGPYQLGSVSKEAITLIRNEYFKLKKENTFKQVMIEDLSSAAKQKVWSEERAHYVIRMPSGVRLDQKENIFHSDNFWSRFGVFLKSANKQLNQEQRAEIKEKIRVAMETATSESAHRTFLPPYSLIENLKFNAVHHPPLSILISIFGLTDEMARKVEGEIQNKMPGSRLTIAETPKDFVNKLENGRFELAISQISFGPIDLMPSLTSTATRYGLANEEYNALYSELSQTHSLQERRQTISSYCNKLENESQLFGLGPIKAEFIVSKNVETNAESLITGELYFPSFLARQN